ncbi:MAG TPA: flagellar FlbD family protein [Candidatus Angelobacter sp.]|nr:flagellar FlbD family protein [Candidatus Angelobacter sp.]
MIQLTRLNQKPFTVNSDLIKFVENTPDTVITLMSGEKFVVLENAETIVKRVVEFRRKLLEGLPLNAMNVPEPALHTPQTGPGERRRYDNSAEEA